jgi:NADH:quinone reductase (non-electrogenic)
VGHGERRPGQPVSGERGTVSAIRERTDAGLGPDAEGRRPRVVVVGGGFGGLAVVKALREQPLDVLLVDQHNYHLFTPLLYQVASALLDPSEVAHPARAILRGQRNVRFHLGSVRSVDLQARQIVLDDRRIDYDYLALAAGSVNDYFGNGPLRRRTYALKDLEQALTLRYRILEQFERASATSDPDLRRRLMSFAVVGAGPTGVEYAGALSELIRLVMRRDFPELDTATVRILLIDGAPQVLGAFRPRLQRAAAHALAHKGITLVLDSLVQDVQDDRVHLTSGRAVEAGTVIWTAGVRGSDLGRTLGVDLARADRVPVEPSLQLAGHPEVFVVGDMAAALDEGQPLPMLSPVAMQQGAWAARNIVALCAGRSPAAFSYRDRGIMATIGRNQAVAEIGPFRFSGRLAWFVWLFVHLALIIGFRNRVVALVDWAGDYFFYDRPVRLITWPSAGAGLSRVRREDAILGGDEPSTRMPIP